MTGPRDPKASQEFFEAAGGEQSTALSPFGLSVTLTALPLPSGTVRVVLTVGGPNLPPLMLGAEVAADHAREMGAALTRVADR